MVSGVYAMAMRDIEELRAKIMLGGGESRMEDQRRRGKLTARERLALLLDPKSFLETDAFTGSADVPGEGVVTGFGTVEGRPVYVYSQDFTAMGGSLGRVHAGKICKVMDLALKCGVPVVGLLDSAGARLGEGLDAVAGYGEVCRRHARCAGLIPQIGVVMGPCIGGAAYAAAMMDFVFLAGKSALMQTWGPQVTEASGGGVASAVENGAAQFAFDTEEECLGRVRELVAMLPANNLEDAPALPGAADINNPAPELNELAAGVYDMKTVLAALSDGGFWLGASEAFAPNLLTGFLRVNGRLAGAVANQPKCESGVLDAPALEKAARFISFCDRFNIPVVSLVDTSGMALGAKLENAGLIRRGAALISAYASASVPKVTVVCGRAHGGAFAIMGSRALGIDTVYAWPGAEISVAGPDTAVNILHAGEIASAEDPQERRAELVERYKSRESNPAVAATGGHVDDIIEPALTRLHIAAALEMLSGKRESRTQARPGVRPV